MRTDEAGSPRVATSKAFAAVVDHLEEVLISVLLGAATLIIFMAFLVRFCAGIPLLYPIVFPLNMHWAQEVAIIMLVWMAKFGAAYGVRVGVHVGVDVLVDKLDVGMRRKVITFSLLAGATFTGIVGTIGGYFVWGLSSSGQVTPDLGIPIWIMYLAIPLGSFLMCGRFLQVARAFRSTGELPHADHEIETVAEVA
ncbi:MAG: TRAP transporter small permease subunit [Steroidobacteraceae bacterium]